MMTSKYLSGFNSSLIKGVILDVDGTLIDSNHAHADSWYRALRGHGFQVSFDKIRSLIGMGSDNFLPAAIGIESEGQLAKEIAKQKGSFFKSDYLPKLKPFPKVPELLERMRSEGLRLVVGSSSEPDELEALLTLAGVSNYVEAQISSGDVENSKPNPDIVHAALDRLQLAPNEVILIGDTPYDIEAASKADVQVIAFRCGGWNDSDLEGALAIFNSPSDLLTNYQTSPLNVQEYNVDEDSD
jgi:HAD superfamily hydrolase (TIGR01509 family)